MIDFPLRDYEKKDLSLKGLILTHISHLKRNCPDYNSVRKASNEAISGFSIKKSGESNG